MQYTKPIGNDIVEFDERKVNEFDFKGFEIVSRSMFSNANHPAVTLKNGSIVFNVYAIRKLGKCSHIQIFVNSEKKEIIAKPCKENEDDAIKWSKEDKNGKVTPKAITNKAFVKSLYDVINLDVKDTFKMFGYREKCGETNAFVFGL